MTMDSQAISSQKKISNYRVIALRWRPKCFSEIIGQDHIIRTLTNAIDSNRIAHAYLFVGPRGTGKTTTARILAMALNAKNGPSSTFDPDDDIARAIADGNCLDVIEIDGASNNSVDQIRTLRDDCQYAPSVCRYKIYIIDEVHMLSNAAFNALLKTLEEPPAHVKFIFATTEAHKVLPTIASRCQRFSFRAVSPKLLTDKLSSIADAEGIRISYEALSGIARLANGGVRDAESLLDSMVNFCDGEITISDINSAYGLADDSVIEEIISAIYYADYKKIIKLSKNIVSDNCDVFQVLCGVENKIYEQIAGILDSSGNYPDRMVRILEEIHRSKDAVKYGISEAINFETALLKAAERGQSRAIDTLLREIRDLRVRVGGASDDGGVVTSSDVADAGDADGGEHMRSRLPDDVQTFLKDNFRAQISIINPSE